MLKKIDKVVETGDLIGVSSSYNGSIQPGVFVENTEKSLRYYRIRDIDYIIDCDYGIYKDIDSAKEYFSEIFQVKYYSYIYSRVNTRVVKMNTNRLEEELLKFYKGLMKYLNNNTNL